LEDYGITEAHALAVTVGEL